MTLFDQTCDGLSLGPREWGTLVGQPRACFSDAAIEEHGPVTESPSWGSWREGGFFQRKGKKGDWTVCSADQICSEFKPLQVVCEMI